MHQPQTLAEEALAAGRPGVATSFRFHRPRGPICGRGHCFACEVETSAGRVLACQTLATGTQPRRRRLRRPLGRIAERWPPWFYERRFLRTEAMRRASLGVLRRASGAGRLATGFTPVAPRAFAEVEAETVVVGAAAPEEDALVVDLAAGNLALGVYPGRVLGALHEGRLLAIRFERLVIAAGAYERLPPIAGNDLPGVVGLAAAARYAAAGALPPGTRIAVWGPRRAIAACEELAARHDLSLVWSDTRPPHALSGRGRLERLHADVEIRCDLFVTGVSQPAIELAMQAGAQVSLTDDGLPILAVTATPDWLSMRGGAAARSSEVPAVAAHDDAFACLCEDVRVRDLRMCVAGGFDQPELVKRRTGAMTGPCQGKLCAAAVLTVLREAGVEAAPTTARPLARPATLGELAAHA
ncbi:MAG TPA: 2Fe-2S iron-sulfur cluster-binding protein [Gaiellaceae bacterium]|nr:2Fe-2S iron-sulfur cluster-binding protein [Gaiellaceae bacterium]